MQPSQAAGLGRPARVAWHSVVSSSPHSTRSGATAEKTAATRTVRTSQAAADSPARDHRRTKLVDSGQAIAASPRARDIA